jgi:hypothetical protein
MEEGMYTPTCRQVCPDQAYFCFEDCDPNPKPDANGKLNPECDMVFSTEVCSMNLDAPGGSKVECR